MKPLLSRIVKISCMTCVFTGLLWVLADARAVNAQTAPPKPPEAPAPPEAGSLQQQLEMTQKQLELLREQMETMRRELKVGPDSTPAVTPTSQEAVLGLKETLRQALEQAKEEQESALEEAARAGDDALRKALEGKAAAAKALEEAGLALEERASSELTEGEARKLAAGAKIQLDEAARALKDAEKEVRSRRYTSDSWADLIGERESRRGERLALGSNTTIEAGETVKALVLLSGSADVYGTVNGDAVVTAGNLTVHPGGVIRGDAVVMSGNIDVMEGGRIEGEQVVLSLRNVRLDSHGESRHGNHEARRSHEPSTPPDEVSEEDGSSFWGRIRGGIILYLVLVATGLVSLTFAPKRVANVGLVLKQRPGIAALIGLVTLIGTIPVTLVLVVTIVGILLIPVLFGLLAAGLVMGATALAQYLAQRIPSPRSGRTPASSLLWGFLIFAGLAILPFIGPLVALMGAMVGLGAVVLSRFGDPAMAPA